MRAAALNATSVDALDLHVEGVDPASAAALRLRHEHARVRRVADQHAHERRAFRRPVARHERQRVDAAGARRAHPEPLERELELIERALRGRDGGVRLVDLLRPRAARGFEQLRLLRLGRGFRLRQGGARLVDGRAGDQVALLELDARS